jgi:hypothetical protein
MKLVLQIVAGIVLAWLVISAAETMLPYTMLARFTKYMQNIVPPLQTPHRTTPEPSVESAPYRPPPMTRGQLDAYIRADEGRPKAEHDATYGAPATPPVKMIRKATPADAEAKPTK